MKKKILFLWVLLSTAVCTFAYDFKSGDLYYHRTGDYTVEVTCAICSDTKNYHYTFTSVVIPETVWGYRVTGIGFNAFANCDSLRSVTIPNSVTTIREYAFYKCHNLTSVNIPNSVTNIGKDAFYYCTSLTSITIPNSVTEVGCNAFGYCTGLTSVSWNANLNDTTIYYDEAIFCYAGDRRNGCEFTFGDEVNRIPSPICANTYLNRVTIGNNVTSIGAGAFYWCSFSGLRSITIPNSVTSIGRYAFYECYLKSITISENITTIEDGVFGENSMTSIIIPESVTTIGAEAFKACRKLKSITIPENVTTIGWHAFYDCDDLQEITFKPMTPPTGCRGAFNDCSYCYHIEKVYVPCGTKRDYTQTFASWSYNWFVEIGTPTISVATEDSLKGTAMVEQQASSCNGDAIISATPAEHYRFAQWNDGNTDNPRTVVVTRDTTYTAEFIPICNITVVYDMKQGYVSGDGTYDLGTQVRLVAEPNSGYEFSQWSDGTTFNPYIFAATEDLTLEALFIPTTAIEDIPAENTEGIQKVLRDGQMYILRNGKAYDIVGREVEF